MVEKLSVLLNGRGGGKNNFAQIGGSNIENLTEAKLIETTKGHLQSIAVVA
jgi:alanyl-tRNA synthetase